MMNAKLNGQRFWHCHEEHNVFTNPNDVPQPACEFQVGVSFLWIEAHPGLTESIVILLETNT